MVITLAVLVALATTPQDAAAARRQVLETYNFHPADLNQQQQDEKSRAMDVFWDKTKAQPDVYLPVVRLMLKEPTTPSFFYFDGAMLLLELSTTAEDRTIAAGAIARCEIRDVSQTGYFAAVHRLAALGVDTTVAAMRVLEDPKFTVSVPQHALTLGQDYAFAYLVLPLEESTWVPALIKRLAAESDPTAQKSLLLTLWYAQTKEADSAITAFASDANKPSVPRLYATELLMRNALTPPPTTASAAIPTEAELRASRRARMKAVSDEALFDLDDLTKQIIMRRKQ